MLNIKWNIKLRFQRALLAALFAFRLYLACVLSLRAYRLAGIPVKARSSPSNPFSFHLSCALSKKNLSHFPQHGKTVASGGKPAHRGGTCSLVHLAKWKTHNATPTDMHRNRRDTYVTYICIWGNVATEPTREADAAYRFRGSFRCKCCRRRYTLVSSFNEMNSERICILHFAFCMSHFSFCISHFGFRISRFLLAYKIRFADFSASESAKKNSCCCACCHSELWFDL